jgi:iron complex outermembrane recepter protein
VTARKYYVATDASAATKTDVPLIEIPQSISVITHDQLELLQIRNLEEATRYTAGIVSGSYGADDRFDWLTLRGFTPTEYLDGLQLPAAAIAEAQSRLDIYALNQIEILKGPASALYGAVPPGGLVDMVSKRPSVQPFTELKVQYGTFNDREVAFDSTGPLNEAKSLAYRVTTMLRDADEQVNYAHTKRFLFAPALTWNISENANLTILSHYQYDDDVPGGLGLPAQGTLLPNPNGPIAWGIDYGEPGYDNYRRTTRDVGYEFNYRLSPVWSVHQDLRYTRLDVNYQTVYAAGLQPDLRTLNRYSYLVNGSPNNLAADSRADAHFTTGDIEHELLVGVDYRKSYDNTSLASDVAPSLDAYNPVYGKTFTNPPISQLNIIHQTQLGAYAQDMIKADKLVLTLSGREDRVQTQNQDLIGGATTRPNDNAFSDRAGANYLFSSGIAPYISYAKSFQPVLGYDYSGTSFKPITGVLYEAGIKYQPPGVKGLLTLNGYQLTEHNALESDPDPRHLGFSVQTGVARVRGSELEGVFRLNNNLSLNGSYAYTNSLVVSSTGPDLGKVLPLVPKQQASVFADYTIRGGSISGLGFGGGARYMGPVFGSPYNTLETPAWAVLDAIVHYDTAHWRFAVNSSNLLDKRYIASCYDLTSCSIGYGRTIMLSVTSHTLQTE